MGKLVGSGKYSSYSSRWLKHKTLLEAEKDVEQGFTCNYAFTDPFANNHVELNVFLYSLKIRARYFLLVLCQIKKT